VHKKILFPFSPGRTMDTGYGWSMELASRMNAVLFFFTAVPETETNKSEFVENLSHSLLKAQGNYLQHTTQLGQHARTQRHIEEGDFTFSLSKFIKKNRFDIVVIDPQASELPKTTLEYVVANSDGVIVLPDQPQDFYRDVSAANKASEKKSTEAFYDVLHHSEIYKLHENFFRTLGRDKGVFNYLRAFFFKSN
jgi:hypothetical protein